MFDDDKPLPEGLVLLRAIILFLLSAFLVATLTAAAFRTEAGKFCGFSQWASGCASPAPESTRPGKGGQ